MEYDVERSILAQKDLCERKCIPLYAPRDGVCYSCYDQIYAEKKRVGYKGREYSTGISTADAGHRHITCCPHCRKSFCD